MNEDELNVDELTPLDELVGDLTQEATEETPQFDLSQLSDEQRAAIAMDYAMKSGELIPRSMLGSQAAPQDPGDENDNLEAVEGETVEQYVQRTLAHGFRQMRQEFEQVYGAGSSYGAAQAVVSMVESTVRVPNEAKQYLTSIVSDLIRNDPTLPGKLKGPQAKQTQEWIADLAIGKAYREGKIGQRTPVTQREPGSLPSGISLREGITVSELNQARAMYRDIHGSEPTNEKMKQLGWVK